MVINYRQFKCKLNIGHKAEMGEMKRDGVNKDFQIRYYSESDAGMST